MQKFLWLIHVAAQGKTKDVKKYSEELKTKRQLGPEDLLRDLRKGE